MKIRPIPQPARNEPVQIPRHVVNRPGRIVVVGIALLAIFAGEAALRAAGDELDLPTAQLSEQAQPFRAKAGASGSFTWWLPRGADSFVLPISGGVLVDAGDARSMRWVEEGSPWELTELPLVGARYGERTLAVIVPWPHYARLVIGDRVGVRFEFPAGRVDATPCEVVARWCGGDPLEIALAFRSWRRETGDTGAMAKPRSLVEKAVALPAVAQLFGAPHIYLWGPALFSRHDVDRGKWIAVARALRDASPESPAGRVVGRFSADQRSSLAKLASAEWAEAGLTRDVALAINSALAAGPLEEQPAGLSLAAVLHGNAAALKKSLGGLLHEPGDWGDGFSLPLIDGLRGAGIDRALLLRSDLYADSPRSDAARKAAELGFLTGPYDSYHSVHDPKAAPDATWATAQFDTNAYTQGRVQNADGSGHGGFKGRGFHFAPAAAWPYVHSRVETILAETPYSAWFVDCDATAECFDDFHPLHPATKVEDIRQRRQRLQWLETEKRLIVGSEGGSALFADVIHFGHGPQTPYLGHLAAAFKDAGSPSFLGRYWPPDAPAIHFKTIPVPRSLRTPYFDPAVRIPLYRCALGDEVIVSHHWSFDSFKLGDVAGVRELMELACMAPPLYHLNRETWPQRRQAIIRHFAFWSPLHRRLATAPLTRFEILTPDRLLQRTTFRIPEGDVTMTVNYGASAAQSYPPRSATVAGAITVEETVFRVEE